MRGHTTTETGAAASLRARWLVRALWLVAAAIVVFVSTVGVATFIQHSGEGEVRLGTVWSADGRRVIIQSPSTLAQIAGVLPGDVLVGISGLPIGWKIERRHLPPILSAPMGETITFTVQHIDGVVENITLVANTPRLTSGRVLVTRLGLPLNAARIIAVVFEGIILLSFVGVAAVLTIRRGDNVMALLLAAALATLGARSSAFHAAVIQEYSHIGTPLMILTAYPVVIMISLYLLWFPTGQFRHRWQRFLFFGYISAELFLALTGLTQIYYITIPFVYVTFLVILVRRYRREFSLGQRQQAKWLIAGVAVGIVGFFVPNAANTFAGDSAYIAVYVIGRLFLLAVPVTMAFAVFRYRLYEVDLVLNRGLVYGGVAVALGVVFAGLFAALHMLIERILGGEQDALAVALSTAAVILLYNPTRKRVQSIVDRKVFGLRVGMDEMIREQDWEHEQTQRLGKRISKTLEVPKVSAAALAVQHIGGYVLRSVLGHGGMGEVYHGEHVTTNHAAAIKILRGDMANNEEFRARFEREAKTLSTLEHPNIVRIIGYGVEENQYYMILEYIAGQTLADYLAENKRLTLAYALPLLADVAAALDYAHARNVVHRDIKPRNVMLRKTDGGYSAVLMDFGIVKWLDGTGSLGGSLTEGGMIGTVDYAAPEQITAAHEIDARADVYALGVMAFAMLTGELPFKGNVGQIIFAHLQQPPPDPHKIDPTIPIDVADAIVRCMAKKPDARFQSAGAFIRALRIAEHPSQSQPLLTLKGTP